MSLKIKILLPVLVMLLLFAVILVWFLNPNKPNADPTPRGITAESLNLDVQSDPIAKTETYRSDNFTGTYEVFSKEVIEDRFELVINHAEVNAGAFKMELLVDGEVVHTFVNNRLTQDFLLEEVTGTVSLQITGESADFMFDYYIYTFHIEAHSVN